MSLGENVTGLHPTSTRERLAAAALDAFASHGFDGVSAREIERLAGVERGLVAYHFGSKKALWTEAVDSIFNRFTDEVMSLRSALRDVSPGERARALIMAYTRFCARYPQFFRILILEGQVKSERSEHLADHVMRSIDIFREVTDLSGPPGADEAIVIFQIIGASGALFASGFICETLFGFRPDDPHFVDRFAAAVAQMPLGAPERFVSSQPPATSARLAR
jgi:AcrR family transcriptional regulator